MLDFKFSTPEEIEERRKYDEDFYNHVFTEDERNIHSRIVDFSYGVDAPEVSELVTDDAASTMFHADYPCFILDDKSQERRESNWEIHRLPSVIAKLPLIHEYNAGRFRLDTLVMNEELSLDLQNNLSKLGVVNSRLIDFEIFEFPIDYNIRNSDPIEIDGKKFVINTEELFKVGGELSNADIHTLFREHFANMYRSVEKIHVQFAAGEKDNKLVYFPIYFGFGTNSICDLEIRSENTGSGLRYFKHCLTDNIGYIEKGDPSIFNDNLVSVYKEFSRQDYIKKLINTTDTELNGIPILRTGSDLVKQIDTILPQYEYFAEKVYDPMKLIEIHGAKATKMKAENFGFDKTPIHHESHIAHELFSMEPLSFQRLKWASLFFASKVKTGEFDDIISSCYNRDMHKFM